MSTFADLLTPRDIAIPQGLVADAEVPVLTGPQRQGDVGVFPRPKLGVAERSAAVPIPAAGVAVVRGESATGGNAHILVGDGIWSPHRGRAGDVLLGVLEVPEGGSAFLIHTEEHGANGIGAGTYWVTGKRELADELRRVAD